MFISDLTVLFNSFFCGGLCVCWKTANLICFQINFKNWGTAKCVCVYIYIKYSVFSYICSACKQYLEKYPEDHNLLWEVEGAGCWFQRTPITTVLQREKLKIAGMDALFCFLMLCKSCTVECLFSSDFCEHCPWKLAERFLFVPRSVRSYLEWLIAI